MIFLFGKLPARFKLLVQHDKFFIQSFTFELCQLQQFVALGFVSLRQDVDLLVLQINTPFQHAPVQFLAIHDRLMDHLPQIDFHFTYGIMPFFDLVL